MSAWIEMISDEDADGDLRDALDLSRTPHGTVDNVLRVHSLRPNTMRGHILLYRAALHDDSNILPVWLQETIGSYVSLLNDCNYSFANHWRNAKHLIGDDARADKFEQCLQRRSPQDMFDGAELAFLQYAEKLTLTPAEMVEEDVVKMKRLGITDGEILEANQIIGYFNYANRCLNGLGVTTDGDVIGYYTGTE
ncbi:MAG: peroxidase-related enzyme [Rhodospirillales bacterium]|nr:peroxidase-related enzyme [Rhodospirillales bacterium]